MKIIKALLFSLIYIGLYLIIQLIFSGIFLGIMMASDSGRFTLDRNMLMELAIKASVYSMPICIIVTFLIYWLIFNIRKKNIFQALSLNKIKPSTILLIIGFTICFYPIVTILAGILSTAFPSSSFNEIQDTFNDMFKVSASFSVIYICILGPTMEEIITRGLIFNEMKMSTNCLIAILVQACLFGIMHLNIVQGVYAFVLGIVYGLFRDKFNSLIIVIICHIVHNSYSVLLDYLYEHIAINDSIIIIVSTIFLVVFSILLFFHWKKHYKPKHLYIS